MLTIDVDVTAVSLDNAVRNVQSQAGSRFLLGKERLENPPHVLLGESQSAITHLDEEGYEQMLAEREGQPIAMNVGGDR